MRRSRTAYVRHGSPKALHGRSPVYSKTSSRGTPKTKAIRKANSSDGEYLPSSMAFTTQSPNSCMLRADDAIEGRSGAGPQGAGWMCVHLMNALSV